MSRDLRQHTGRFGNGGMASSVFFVQLTALFLAFVLHAAEVLPPTPARYFNDFAAVTKAGTADRLNAQLEQFERDTSSQIVVAVFQKMQSDSSIEDYVNRMFRAWRIGQKGKNNGVLFAVFVQDRKMRIEVGYGLEGAIPDAIARRIIDERVAPQFKAGNFDAGLSAGVTALMQAARGEFKGTGRTVANPAARTLPRTGAPSTPVALPVMIGMLVAFVIVAIVISSLVRGMRGTVYGRGRRSRWSSSPAIWTDGGRWGGGGGWSGGDSGGGGFSGGGGDSGGGGASGSW